MTTTVSSKGQVTIPKEIRDRLGIEPGTLLEFQAERGRLVARKVQPADPFAKWAGAFADGRRSDDLLASLRGEPEP
jgi:AbrB family looped-hinge helix DNA binding protein